MSQEKVNIILSRINDRIERGEFDDRLDIPFASRKLLKSLVKAKIDRKVETNSTPMLSENELVECVEDVRATAAETAVAFLNAGILEKTEDGIKITEPWNNILNPPKN